MQASTPDQLDAAVTDDVGSFVLKECGRIDRVFAEFEEETAKIYCGDEAVGSCLEEEPGRRG